MTAFADQLHNFTAKVPRVTQAAFVGTVTAAWHSIQFGSPITGAPGQPVARGELRDSWQISEQTRTSALISTDKKYALSNEDGIARPGRGPYKQVNPAIGGRWSVALTRAGIQPLLDSEVARIAA